MERAAGFLEGPLDLFSAHSSMVRESAQSLNLLQCLALGLFIQTISFSPFGSEIYPFLDLSLEVHSYAEGICSLFTKTFKNLTYLN